MEGNLTTLKTYRTGIPDVDRNILLELDDNTLFAACIADEYASELCDNFFWYRKFVKTFDIDLDQYGKQNYRNLYKLFRKKTDSELLVIAAERGYLNLIIKLKEDGLVIDRSIANNLLIHASTYGQLEIVKYLVEIGADFYTDNHHPLKTASFHGHLSVVKYLIEIGDYFRYIEDSPVRGIEYLIAQGNLYAINKSLILASKRGHLDIVKYMVEHGADISVVNDPRIKAAVKYEYMPNLEYLLDQGDDIQSRDNI